MGYTQFVTDLAIEAAQISGAYELSAHEELGFGITKHTLNISNNELAKRIGRERGVYITYDCPSKIYSDSRAAGALRGYITKSLARLLGTVKKSSPVLVIGLGNAEIVADSLGERTALGIDVTRQAADSSKQCMCAFSTGVLGTTGIQSAELTSAVVDKIKPAVVILVDSLATGNVSRIGTSFQLSTAGISPGSGVGQDKERIDKSVLGVPVVAVGVPLMLSLRTALYSFVKSFLEQQDMDVNEFCLRERLAEKQLAGLVVAPKDIDFMVANAAMIISEAINKTFNAYS